jgi:hypothetical protein
MTLLERVKLHIIQNWLDNIYNRIVAWYWYKLKRGYWVRQFYYTSQRITSLNGKYLSEDNLWVKDLSEALKYNRKPKGVSAWSLPKKIYNNPDSRWSSLTECYEPPEFFEIHKSRNINK